jgi:protein-export membrane protein SecD
MSQNFFAQVFAKTPKRRAWWVFVLIMAITLAAALVSNSSYYNNFSSKLADKTKNFVVLPKVKDVPFRLGLDLQGGTQLVYEADVKNVPEVDKNAAVEGVRDVIERRVNIFGVSEPVIQVNKTVNGNYRIIAELAGVKDVGEAIKMIGETPLLEFKEQGDTKKEITAEDKNKISEFNKALGDKAKQVLDEALKTTDFVALAKTNNQPKPIDATVDAAGGIAAQPAIENDGDLGWLTEKGNEALIKPLKNLRTGEVLKQVVETADSYKILKVEEKRLSDPKKEPEYRVREISLVKMTEADINTGEPQWNNTQLTGKYLKRTSIEFDPNDNSPQVALEFNAEGSKLFEEITGRNIGKQVAIFLDGYPISAPTVNEKITGGKAVISGRFTVQEAKLLSQRLNAGALPVPISLVSQQTVGATLGQQSVTNSVQAGLVGLIIVALFMIVFYRLPGLLAVGALVVYGLVSLALFKLWPVTLTLSGIAGFILSIGMAVDANILIFERMKEELRAGKALGLAITDGFNRAWPSIRDSNFTTIIVCLVLISFSTSIIKGFAVTLLLGVLISLFSAIFVTKNFLKLISNRWLEKYQWLITSVKKETK